MPQKKALAHATVGQSYSHKYIINHCVAVSHQHGRKCSRAEVAEKLPLTGVRTEMELKVIVAEKHLVTRGV